MTNNELKTMAIEKLAAAGVECEPLAAMRTICQKIAAATGNSMPANKDLYGFIFKYAVPVPKPNGRFVRPFEPMKYVPHPREADIDAGQTPMGNSRSVGNGVERKHGYGRG